MIAEEALYALAINGGSNGKSILRYIPEAVAGVAGAGGGYMLTRKPVFGIVGAIAGVLTVSLVKSLFVEKVPEVKSKVKQLYNKAHEEGWNDIYIYPNEAEIMLNCTQTVNGTVLFSYHELAYMPPAQKEFIENLGFTLREIEHIKYTNGSQSFWHCHIQYNGQELTADELWLPEIKQRAITLGYDVRDYGDCIIDWGIHGAYDDLATFLSESGIMSWTAQRCTFNAGYLWTLESIYAQSMHSL